MRGYTTMLSSNGQWSPKREWDRLPASTWLALQIHNAALIDQMNCMNDEGEERIIAAIGNNDVMHDHQYPTNHIATSILEGSIAVENKDDAFLITPNDALHGDILIAYGDDEFMAGIKAMVPATQRVEFGIDA